MNNQNTIQQNESYQGLMMIDDQDLEEPKSFQDQRLNNNLLDNCFNTPIPLVFNNEDLQIFYEFVSEADQNFDEGNPLHVQELGKLYELVYGQKLSNKDQILFNEKWPEMGFQNYRPGTDFRGGGLLSLEALVYFCEKENLDDIIEFSNKYSNYLFACVNISTVFFLKKYLHFGVFSQYQKKLDIKSTCKLKEIKYFLSLNRDQGFQGVKEAFFEIVRILSLQIFFFWKLQYKQNPKLTILDFKQVEERIEMHFKRCFKKTARKQYMNRTNKLNELKKQLQIFSMNQKIIPIKFLQLNNEQFIKKFKSIYFFFYP